MNNINASMHHPNLLQRVGLYFARRIPLYWRRIHASPAEEFALSLQLLPGGKLKDVQHGLAILPEYKLIYTPVSKVACTKIKRTLLLLHTGKVYEDLTEIHARATDDLPSINNFSADEFFHILTSKEYFSFMFCRNPYARLLSAYKDLIQNTHTREGVVAKRFYFEYERIIRHARKKKGEAATFADFVRFVCAQPYWRMNPHWYPQYWNSWCHLLTYDFIGRFENFTEDFRFVLNKTGAPKNVLATLDERVNSTTSGPLREYYTPELVEMVNKKFAVDFEFFGYSNDINGA